MQFQLRIDINGSLIAHPEEGRPQSLDFLFGGRNYGSKREVHVSGLSYAMFAVYCADGTICLEANETLNHSFVVEGEECYVAFCEIGPNGRAAKLFLTPNDSKKRNGAEENPTPYVPIRGGSATRPSPKKHDNAKKFKPKPESDDEPESEVRQHAPNRVLRSIDLIVNNRNILIVRFANEEEGITRFLNSLKRGDAPRKFGPKGQKVMTASLTEVKGVFALSPLPGYNFSIQGKLCSGATLTLRPNDRVECLVPLS